MRDSGALEGFGATFLKAGVSCVSENQVRLPDQAAFLLLVSNSVVCSAHTLRTHVLFLSPKPCNFAEHLPGSQEVFVGGWTIHSHSPLRNLCVQCRKVGNNSCSLGTHAVLQETCSEIPKQARE